MAPSLAATASGSAREAGERSRAAGHLTAASSFRVIGSEELSKAAVDLLDDGSLRGVDALLDTGKELFVYRFRLDSNRRVVDFSRRPRQAPRRTH
jgi:hypothetical protein